MSLNARAETKLKYFSYNQITEILRHAKKVKSLYLLEKLSTLETVNNCTVDDIKLK